MSGMEVLTLGSALPTGCQLLTAHSKAILVQKLLSALLFEPRKSASVTSSTLNISQLLFATRAYNMCTKDI
jgi:uncharacterized membrane protein YgdD (TMEM256/DUF423 family)